MGSHFTSAGLEIAQRLSVTPEPESPWLYDGAAGRLVFYLEAYQQTGEAWILKPALNLADRLAGIDENTPGLPLGLYTGLAGTAFALERAARAGRREHHAAAAARMVSRLLESATPATAPRGGVEWIEQVAGPDGPVSIAATDVMSGAAGIGLQLLGVGPPHARAAARAATAAGVRLVALAGAAPGGVNWDSGIPAHRLRMPGFSHGSAGIGHFLARAGAAGGGATMVETAVAAGRHLAAIAATEGGICVVPRYDPAQEGGPEYALGWCHGPHGPAALFRELHLATRDPHWRDLYAGCANSYVPGAIPETIRPRMNRFGDRDCWCHGRAGNAVFLLHAGADLGDPALAAAGRALAAEIDSSTIEETGFGTGLAGIGFGLLLAGAAEDGRGPAVRLPDWPFADSRMARP